MPYDSTIQDVLEAVQGLATHVDGQFAHVDGQFTDIRSKMATKDDLAGFAAKEDLKNFATKDDLKNFATKEDLADVRYELRDKIADVRAEMATKNDLATLKNDIITEIDRFALQYKTYDIELVSLRSRCDRIEANMTKAG